MVNFLLMIIAMTISASEGRRGFEELTSIIETDTKYEKEYNLKPDQVTYDENRNITAISYHQGQVSYQYEYDSKNRLIRAKYNGPDSMEANYGQTLPQVKHSYIGIPLAITREKFIELNLSVIYNDFSNLPKYFKVSGLMSQTVYSIGLYKNAKKEIISKDLIKLHPWRFIFHYGLFNGVTIDAIEGYTATIRYPYYEILSGNGEAKTLVLEETLVKPKSSSIIDRLKKFKEDVTFSLSSRSGRAAIFANHMNARKVRRVMEVFLNGGLFRKASHIPFKTRELFF